MNRVAVRVLVCLLLVGTGLLVCVGVGSAAAPASPPASDAPASSGVEDLQDEGDATSPLAGYDQLVQTTALHGNGSASTTVEYRYRLDDGNRTVDWEGLEGNVSERPDDYVEWFEGEWNRTLETAEEQTGREMSVNDTTVDVENQSMPSAYGTVRFSFTWSGFAHVEVNRIEAGDALGGFMLDERTRLVVSWPEEYERRNVQPAPDDTGEDAIIWDGGETQEFVEDEPRLEVIRGGESVDAGETQPTTPWLAGAGALALVALLAGGWWLIGGDGRRTDETPAAPASAEPDDPADDETEPPLDLLSNEERVLRLLGERGGRIKQQEVVAELDWTEAKTSQVVGSLREQDAIEVFRIGRENVLALPDGEEARAG